MKDQKDKPLVMKVRPSLSTKQVTAAQFYPLDTICPSTEFGSFTNRHWILKKEVTPRELVKRTEKVKKEYPIIPVNVEKVTIWNRIRNKMWQGKPINYLYSIDVTHSKDSHFNSIPIALFKDHWGEVLGINEKYIVYLIQKFPGVEFSVEQENSPKIVKISINRESIGAIAALSADYLEGILEQVDNIST